MDEAKKFSLIEPPVLPDIEDAETLAAINEGLEDAKAGRMHSIEEVREHLSKWLAASSTPKEL